MPDACSCWCSDMLVYKKKVLIINKPKEKIYYIYQNGQNVYPGFALVLSNNGLFLLERLSPLEYIYYIYKALNNDGLLGYAMKTAA